MPVYNSNWCIKEVLESIYEIDYSKKLMRLVFVDSLSTDGTFETLQQFKEKHETEYESIILVGNVKRGLGLARNICLKYVKGFVFWADSDITLPEQVLKVLTSHFQRDPKLGWARIPWVREIPSFYEKILLSKIPKGIKYLRETDIPTSLVRPEVIKCMGALHDDGGYPFDAFEMSDHYVRICKAGWKILIDGSLSSQCIHLGGNYGVVCEDFFKNLLCLVRYYFTRPVRRPVHETAKAGDVQLIIKLLYYFIMPYIAIYAAFKQPFLLIYVAPSFIWYINEVRGWRMKIIAPFFLISRWVVLTQGYAFFLFKKLLHFKWCKDREV